MEQSSIPKSLAFDDVLIKPARSSVLPNSVITNTKLTKNINLGIPLISSAMDTVTEYKLAIAIAQAGGMGILHKKILINTRKRKKKILTDTEDEAKEILSVFKSYVKVDE